MSLTVKSFGAIAKKNVSEKITVIYNAVNTLFTSTGDNGHSARGLEMEARAMFGITHDTGRCKEAK